MLKLTNNYIVSLNEVKALAKIGTITLTEPESASGKKKSKLAMLGVTNTKGYGGKERKKSKGLILRRSSEGSESPVDDEEALGLRYLELLGNPICEMNMYSKRVFKALPHLEVLDGQDRNGNEVVTDEEDVNEDHDLDDYGDEQDMIADGVIKDPKKAGGDDGDDSVGDDGDNDEEALEEEAGSSGGEMKSSSSSSSSQDDGDQSSNS